MKKYTFLILTIPILLITSCIKQYDPQFAVYYNVQNNTDSGIKVIYNGLCRPSDYYYGGQKVPDSVILIRPGEKSMIYVVLLSGTNKGNHEIADTLKTVHTFQIFRQDTIPANKNFRSTQYWNYTQDDDTKAEMLLTVNRDDFNH